MNVDVVTVDAPFEVTMKAEPMEVVIQGRVRSETSVRAGLYKSYAPSMDEGWTRWMLDHYRFPYKSLLDAEVRSGKLREKYDAIILPDQSASAITNGLRAGNEAGTSEEDQLGRYPAEFAGGLGDAGIRALVEFVSEGGTLITFNNASNFPIEKMNAPVRNILKGVSVRDFYCPGSILRIQLDDKSPISFPLGKDAVAWFEASPVFEATDAERVRVIARYPESETPLLSGWILGDQLLKGKAALVEVKMGKGRIIMFGFRPQYRGQSLATFPLVFNAMLSAAN
jgi:hypothetical protein